MIGSVVRALETKRLVLRPLMVEDADFILELFNEPAFIENVADRGLRNSADATEYLRNKILPSYEQYGFGFYLVELKPSGLPLGICGLLKRETLEDVDIGYAFLQKFCGNGYAYESAAAVMNYARGELGLQRIVAITAPGNHSSAKLLEKLGLRFEKMVHLPGYSTESKLFA
jgi:RimJ/RimL family protein N-acetyltransferase